LTCELDKRVKVEVDLPGIYEPFRSPPIAID